MHRMYLQVIKYGVICLEDLLDDLKTWKWLYTSGRLHKPVRLTLACNMAVQCCVDTSKNAA